MEILTGQLTTLKRKELKTACDPLMAPQQHLYNGLVRHVDCGLFHFCTGIDSPAASPCWHRNGLNRTDSVLAYGQRGTDITKHRIRYRHEDG